MLEYVALIQREEVAGEAGPSGPLPDVTPIVVHNGPRKWPAARAGKPRGTLGRVLARPYLLVDVNWTDPDGLDANILLPLMMRIEQAKTSDRLLELRQEADAELARAGQDRIRFVVRVWIEIVKLRRVDPDGNLPPPPLETDEQEADMSALMERARKWGDQQNQEWLEKGKAEAARDSVLLAASRKFGSVEAERLGPALDCVSDPDRIVELVGTVFECGTVDEVITAANGGA